MKEGLVVLLKEILELHTDGIGRIYNFVSSSGVFSKIMIYIDGALTYECLKGYYSNMLGDDIVKSFNYKFENKMYWLRRYHSRIFRVFIRTTFLYEEYIKEMHPIISKIDWSQSKIHVSPEPVFSLINEPALDPHELYVKNYKYVPVDLTRFLVINGPANEMYYDCFNKEAGLDKFSKSSV
jgi:hypothetical protein